MLKFHPKPGSILMCDYRTGFAPPEMVKARPVVVVSPRLRRREGLCTIVPFSTTPPAPVEAHHCALRLLSPLPKPFDAPDVWAKCDMLATVSFQRLDLIRVGKRKYIVPELSDHQLEAVRRGVLHALGMGLTLEAIERTFLRSFAALLDSRVRNIVNLRHSRSAKAPGFRD